MNDVTVLSKIIKLLVAYAISFLPNFVFAQQVEIKKPFEYLALQGIFKESSLNYIEVDMDSDGLKDLLINVNPELGTSRGERTWTLLLNKGDHYIDIPSYIELWGHFDIKMVNDWPAIINTYPSGGSKATESIDFLKNNVMEIEEIAEIITDGEPRVKQLKAVVIGEELEQIIRYKVKIKDLVSADIFNQLKSRKEDPYSLYYFRKDPDRPGNQWAIAIDKKTKEPVGHFNRMTEELVPLKDVYQEELENEKSEDKTEPEQEKRPEATDLSPTSNEKKSSGADSSMEKSEQDEDSKRVSKY